MLLAGAYYEDPYLLAMADSDYYGRPSSYDQVFALLFRAAGLEKRPLAELPLSKYFPGPMGEMVARTGWRMGLDTENRDAVVHMRIGEYFFGNDYRMGRVTAHEFGPSPTVPFYSYIAGDIAQAYSSSKVENVARSMVMLDAVPKGPSVRQIRSEDLIGVKVLDTEVLFGRDDEMLKRVEFVLDGAALTKMLICDLSPGSWSITRDGKQTAMTRATEEGRCIYLEALPGSYCLELKIVRQL